MTDIDYLTSRQHVDAKLNSQSQNQPRVAAELEAENKNTKKRSD